MTRVYNNNMGEFMLFERSEPSGKIVIPGQPDTKDRMGQKRRTTVKGATAGLPEKPRQTSALKIDSSGNIIKHDVVIIK